MKTSWLLPALSLISIALSAETIPFHEPVAASEQKRAFEVLQALNKRVANNCPGGYNPCSNLNNLNVCCRTDAHCARDGANNIACCPNGASCTGSLAAATGTTSSFMFPQTATATATGDATSTTNGISITGSTMNGAYPFVHVPTTFADAATCSAYYSRCQSDYTQCTSSLGNNGQYAVTVAGNNGAGVTVQGGEATPVVSACSNLRLQACHGLNLGYCDDAYGSGGGNENAAASFRGPMSLTDLMFGMVVGVAGMFI